MALIPQSTQEIPGANVTDTYNRTINNLNDLANVVASKGLLSSARCVLIGDSITNQCYQDLGSGSFGISQAGYFATASLATMGLLRLVAELGVPGETSEQILARVPNALATYKPAILVVMAGTNDITNASISGDTTIANLLQIAMLCRDAGVICAMFTIPPKNTAVDNSTNVFATKHAYINHTIQYVIGNMPNVVVADSYSTTVDIATGLWASGMSTDGTHPLAQASIRHGISLGDAINRYLNTSYRPITQFAHQLDGWNMVYNPYMTGNNAIGTNGWTGATGITGNGPNGYAGARLVGTPVAVCSVIAETDTLMRRQWTRMTISSFSANSDCPIIRSDINQNSTYPAGAVAITLGSYRRPTVATGYAYRCITAGTTVAGQEPTWPTTLGRTVTDAGGVVWQTVPLVEAGSRYVACFEYAISSAVGNVSPVLNVSCRDSGGSVVSDFYGNRRATAEIIPDTFVPKGVIWSPEFICPANVNRIQVNCGLYGSSGGSAVFDVTGMQLIKVPPGYAIQTLLTSTT